MKRIINACTFTFAFLLLAAVSVDAQIKTPAPSPFCSLTQSVGLMEVSIKYSRPGVKDRVIYGKLVPYGELWRTGANASTKISFSDDATVGGVKVPAGDYSLYTIPGESSWTIIINKNLKTGTSDYNKEEDAARFTVKPTRVNQKVETFTINVTDVKMDAANIELVWENTSVKFMVETDVDTKVMADIAKQTAGVDANVYYQSARYYYDTNKDMNKALEWINLATKENPKFWMVRYKALILAKLGKYDDAIKAANESTELANEAGNKDYPRMNGESIAEWKAMKK